MCDFCLNLFDWLSSGSISIPSAAFCFYCCAAAIASERSSAHFGLFLERQRQNILAAQFTIGLALALIGGAHLNWLLSESIHMEEDIYRSNNHNTNLNRLITQASKQKAH